MAPQLTVTNGFDFRSLAPALETRATNRYQDLQGSGRVDREHEVRWVLSLWHEPDPKTRAILLVGFAVSSEFHPDKTPEEWSRLKGQLQQCLAGLPREDLIAVVDFLRWMKNEGRPTVQQAIPIQRAEHPSRGETGHAVLATGSPEDHRDAVPRTVDPSNARLAFTHDSRPYPGRADSAAYAPDLGL